jgi:hypothetical protein
MPPPWPYESYEATKRKSQIWDSKIWSRVPRDSDSRETTLARASNIYKRQTRPLVREGAPQNQDRNCQRVINTWSCALDGARQQDLTIDWPSVAMWLVEEKGSLECETVKYGHESNGTRTREWLRWRGPAAIVNDRPVLSSDWAFHRNKPAIVWW